MLEPVARAVRGAARVGRGARPGFLVGYGKSGTNWAGSLLNLHPRVRCDGEFHFEHFLEARRRFEEGPWLVGHRPEVREVTVAALEALVRGAMRAAARAKPGVSWIIDRTPRPFEVLIPGAPHFYLVRDGRDALVSFTFHQLRAGHPDRFPPEVRGWLTPHWEAFRRDPEAMGPGAPGLLGEEQWVRFHARRWAEQVRRDHEAVALAQKAGTPVLAVKYEDLHADTERWRARMYEHLGLDPARAAPISAESRTTAGFALEDRRSFYRKGQVGDWKNYGSGGFRAWFKEETGSVLVELGYEPGAGW